ncbi:unnamed protein product [Cylicocyclus nassatus]|uniref:Polyprotein allergen nematode domain-containing protein n=1 Tax=Cylicocyclus nassatus TaxID=53992 RepID=A0AA36GC46_CYLNA|nr:unnamed protein product [Cylicocyclus nassatus]
MKSVLMTLLVLFSVSQGVCESGRFTTKEPMRRQHPRTGSKAVRNLVFASKLWMTADQSKRITDLQDKGDDEAVVEQLTGIYRGLDDRTRASLRVQSTCRAILAEEVGQHAVDELIALKTKVAPSSDFVEKLNSLFGLVKKTDVAVIQPLCAAAYEDSHVPTANDPPRLRRNGQVVAAA